MHEKLGITRHLESLMALTVIAVSAACSGGEGEGRQSGSGLTESSTGGKSGSGNPGGPVPVIGGSPGSIGVVIGGSSTTGQAGTGPTSTGPVCNAETRAGKRVPVDLH